MPQSELEKAAATKIPWPAAIIIIIVAGGGGILAFTNVLSPSGDLQISLGAPEFYVECIPTTATAANCTATNSGTAAGSVCFDLVVVCDDGNHVGHACVEGVQSGGMSNKIVHEFNPVLDGGTSCAGMEIQHLAVR